MATVVVVGGGISGLAAAYYLQRNAAKLGKVILLESSKRTGGWMNSVQHGDGSVFEHGPRSLRPAGKAGRNTLHLVEELGLSKDILVVRRSDPAAKNRFLYVGHKLCALPNSISGVVKTVPPFSRPLLVTLMGEAFAKKNTSPDETIHDFMQRRLGKEFADYAVDAVCRGIFAADCRQLSMRSCFPDIFTLERQHGSLTMGMLKARGSKLENASPLESRAKSEGWASWSLRQGLQQLSDTMTTAVNSNPKCEVRTHTPCWSLVPSSGKIKVCTEGEEILADHVFSAAYSRDLAALLTKDFAELRSELESIKAVSVYVVNLEYLGDHLPLQGFGHLLPSCENPNVLGVVYDSCTFPQHNRRDNPSTRLTVMLGGAWFDGLRTEAGDLPTEERVIEIATGAVCEQLGISHDIQPSKVKVILQKECIPQYTLGHADRLSRIALNLSKSGLPLRLIGSSYRGVSVNDCINNARMEVEGLLCSL
ncbi:hypothetical protein BaRGS_00034342 [Batillaria attramentaria]|uniref:Protoporphyrinogen oxidase n=1 Tax=Batillaria attramentaria TaxID=370345 RepID=A0ABD0JHN0_9CAEN